jgi:hypothetical protein
MLVKINPARLSIVERLGRRICNVGRAFHHCMVIFVGALRTICHFYAMTLSLL